MNSPAKRVDSKLSAASKQSENMLFDITKNCHDKTELVAELKRRMANPSRRTLIIIDDGEILDIIKNKSATKKG